MKHISRIKYSIYLICLLTFGVGSAQSALQNSGNIQIHEDGQMGFHIDLINNGTFDQNLGLAGFYNAVSNLVISGTQEPKFYDAEMEVPDGLNLEISTLIENSFAYIEGKVITPRDNPQVNLRFLSDAIYLMESNTEHTDGYTSFFGSRAFIFPIGDDNKLRPLRIPPQNAYAFFNAAYFNEDPNFPSTFNQSFDTENSEVIIDRVYNNEFWDLDGDQETFITLTWDQSSMIGDFVEDLDNLRVVGWNIAEQQWKDLGNLAQTGTLSEGTITSIPFVPDEYEILTFGKLIGDEGIVVYNLFSPNNDGKNDSFVIEGIELFRNELKIFNRWGSLVHQAKNYQNDWDGRATEGTLFSKGERLPVGTYFYVLKLTESNRAFAGWIYINY